MQHWTTWLNIINKRTDTKISVLIDDTKQPPYMRLLTLLSRHSCLQCTCTEHSSHHTREKSTVLQSFQKRTNVNIQQEIIQVDPTREISSSRKRIPQQPTYYFTKKDFTYTFTSLRSRRDWLINSKPPTWANLRF